MKSTWAPGLQPFPLHPTGQPCELVRHQKTVRFFRKLTDAQVLAFVAALDRTLASSGMDPGPLRQTMMHFASGTL